MTEKKIFPPIASIIAGLSLCLLVGCGGGGGISTTTSGAPDEERQVVDLPDDFIPESPDPHETPATQPQSPNLLNDLKLTLVKAPQAWEHRARDGGYTGDGVVVGIMEEVNSFHPDLANKIHEASVLTSPYPAGAPVPDERFVVDEADFARYPVVPCLLQYGFDCPDNSGADKYFLRLSDGELRLLPGLYDHCQSVRERFVPCQRVTIGDNDPKAPEFGASHGTGVASVAAADNEDNVVLMIDDRPLSLQGVAYDSDILVYARPLNIAGLASSFQDHVNYFLNAPDEADVYNFSHTFGAAVIGVDTAFGDQIRASGFAEIARAIGDMGKPLIAAAGNEGNEGEIFPRFPAALPAFFPNLRGQVLAVTAIGSNGRITSYANPCGALPSDWDAAQHGRHYCLAAPGGDNNDLFWVAGPENNHYSKTAGTSFAAPMVAGAFAILKEQFRGNLNDRQIIDRMMDTASRAEIYEDETIYGAGLLDLEAATDTVGTPVVSITGDINNGITRDFDATLLSSSAAFGDALQRALQSREIAAFDELGAPFWYPLASLTRTTSNRKTLRERQARLFERTDAPVETELGGRFALTSSRVGPSGQIDMSLRQPVDISAAQVELLLAAGDLSTAPLGLHEDKSFAHPYLHFAGEGIGLGGSLQLGAGRLAAMGFTSGSASVSEDIPVHAHGGLLEYALESFAGVELGLQAGAMVEESRTLGLLSEGGFGDMGESSTAFAGVSLDGALEEGWRFRASMLFGRTNLDAPSMGLLATSSNLASSAFRFAFEGSGVLLDADRMDVFVAQPLRIESGEASFIIPVARTPSGSITRERINGISLEPGGRELEFGTRYEMQVREDIVATGGVGIVHEGGHSKQQATEFYGLANLRFHF